MDTSAARSISAEEFLFHDGFGDRLLIRDSHGTPLHESLLLSRELSSVPAFEFALTQRVKALEQFEDAHLVKIRRLVSVGGAQPRLSLIADYSGGTRLTEILAAMERRDGPRTFGAPLFLIREILAGVAVLHRQGTDISHGALSPERIVVADGNVRITDYVMGAAIEQLRFSSERYWKDLRVAMPASAGALRFDKRLDVAQVGMIALALFAGRELREAEHMGNLGEALMGLALPQSLRAWLLRMVHMDPRRVFVNAVEAGQGLEDAITDAGVRPSALDLEVLGVRQSRVRPTVTVRTAEPRTPAPAPAPIAPPRDVKKTMVRAPQSEDLWKAHDVAPATMAARQDVRAPIAADKVTSRKRLWTVLTYLMMAGSIGGAFAAARYGATTEMLFSDTGTLVVESKPQGVELLVDGESQGVTPVTVKVKSGRHEVELRDGAKPRVFNVFVSSGASVSQYVELRATTARAKISKTSQ